NNMCGIGNICFKFTSFAVQLLNNIVLFQVIQISMCIETTPYFIVQKNIILGKNLIVYRKFQQAIDSDRMKQNPQRVNRILKLIILWPFRYIYSKTTPNANYFIIIIY